MIPYNSNDHKWATADRNNAKSSGRRRKRDKTRDLRAVKRAPKIWRKNKRFCGVTEEAKKKNRLKPFNSWKPTCSILAEIINLSNLQGQLKTNMPTSQFFFHKIILWFKQKFIKFPCDGFSIYIHVAIDLTKSLHFLQQSARFCQILAKFVKEFFAPLEPALQKLSALQAAALVMAAVSLTQILLQLAPLSYPPKLASNVPLQILKRHRSKTHVNMPRQIFTMLIIARMTSNQSNSAIFIEN